MGLWTSPVPWQTPPMDIHLLAGWSDELCKLAVSLDQLRSATKPLMSRLIRARPSQVLPSNMQMPSPAVAVARTSLPRMERSLGYLVSKGHLPESAMGGIMKGMRSLKPLHGRIVAKGDMSRQTALGLKGLGGRMDLPRTPAGREAFNRTALLHEGAELGRHPGRFPMAEMGHISARPPLQDLNIAATLKGPGVSAARSIRQMRRRELGMLTGEFPDLKRLHLGRQRVSRHAIRRIQDLWDGTVAKKLRTAGLEPDRLASR